MSSKDFEEKKNGETPQNDASNKNDSVATEKNVDENSTENAELPLVEKENIIQDVEKATNDTTIDKEEDIKLDESNENAEVEATTQKEETPTEDAQTALESKDVVSGNKELSEAPTESGDSDAIIESKDIDEKKEVEETEEIEEAEEVEDKPKEIKPKKDNVFKKFFKKYKIAVIISAIVLLIAIGVTTTVLIVNAPKMFIRTAADFEKQVGKKETFLLKKDITVDGDLVITNDLNFNLNNKTLTINGTLKITLDDANTNTIEVGTQKGFFKKQDFTNGGKVVAKKVEIVAKGITLNIYSPMSLSGNISVNTLTFNEKITIDNDSSLMLRATNATINNDITGTIDLVLSNLNLSEGASIDKINADKNSTAKIYGDINNSINGGKEISLLGKATCPIVKGAIELYLEQETVSLDDAIDITTIYVVTQLAQPNQLNIEQVGTTFLAVASKVNGADQYVFTIKDGNETIVTIDSPNNECDITKHITAPQSYKISVKAIGEDIKTKLPSSELEIQYDYNIKLANPQLTIEETENNNIIISFPSIPFAKVYKVNINGTEKSVDASEATTTIIDVTEDVATAGAYYIKIIASYPGNASFTDSNVVMESYVTKIKFTQPIVTVEKIGNNISVSWETVPNCKNYILKVNNLEYITTSTSKTFALQDIEDETSFTVFAQGIGFYTSSETTSALYSYTQLDKPQNIIITNKDTSIIISADLVNNATGYILYKNGKKAGEAAVQSFEVSEYSDGDIFKIEATAPYYKSASSENITFEVA